MDCLEIRAAKIFWFTQGNLWKWNGFPFADILYIGKTDVWIQNPRAGRWIHRVICTLCFFRFLNNSGTPVLVLSLNPRSLVSSPTSDPWLPSLSQVSSEWGEVWRGGHFFYLYFTIKEKSAPRTFLDFYTPNLRFFRRPVPRFFLPLPPFHHKTRWGMDR